jgi:Lecithin retinol acyltransferase
LCYERGCRVNNLEEAARERGLLPPFPPDVTVERARQLLRGGRFSIYNVLTDNCEHFATNCRYGEPFSLQVYSCLAPFRLISTLGSTVYNTFFSTNNPQAHALEVIFDEVRRNEERNGEH